MLISYHVRQSGANAAPHTSVPLDVIQQTDKHFNVTAKAMSIYLNIL